MPQWLKNAVFYEIYPQSYFDSNGDGVGDINGITSKLDYVKSLGFNALWLNPCFVSPFKDAGYDVQDYLKVAPRYGTNEDLYRLFDEAHARGMHVILDLVPGHTSEKHKWFRQSCKPTRNKYSERYIWTNKVWERPAGYSWVAGNADRDGCYMLNFFECQPALNYGFNEITDPSWQISYKDKRVKSTLKAMIDVMRFWLSHGADGFRVDMADSLVKNDPDKTATASLWRKVRKVLDEDYPEAVLVSEWCNAPRAINNAHFHCDFLLSHWKKLVHYAFRYTDEQGVNKSYFCKTAHVSAHEMLRQYLDELRQTQGNGYISVITGNHDTERISYMLDEHELRLAYTFLLTLPGVPFFYYGDEIAMRYLPQPSKEGGYNRTGSRTPMQWDSDAVNLGFSTADVKKLYLDVDRAPDAPCAKQQMADEHSLLNFVRKLNAIRQANPDLQADGQLEVLYCSDDGVLCYKRGEHTAVLINPTDEPRTAPVAVSKIILEVATPGAHGSVRCAKTNGNVTELAPQTAVIFTL